MVMTLTPEIQFAADTAIARGIGRSDAAALIHRLLWAVGVEARSHHHASFGRNALLMGGLRGTGIAVFGAAYALHMHPQGGADIIVRPIFMALVAAVAD